MCGLGISLIQLGDAVSEKAQGALGSDFGIELTQAARSGIARIGKCLTALGRLALIQGIEIGFEHQHLTTHFQTCRRRGCVQMQWNTADGFDIVGDIFALAAIATGSGL